MASPFTSALRVFAIVAVFGLPAVGAEDPEEPVEPSEPIVEEVTVTATTSALDSMQVAVPTQIITREQITALGTLDLDTVLEAIPGIVVRRNTSFSLGASTVGFQGAAEDQVAILMDGAPFVGDIDGSVDLRDVPLTNIERIEIVRGPSSALYGSQAMAGVINIITRGGEESGTGTVELGGGSFGHRFLKASHAGRMGRARYSVAAQAASFRPEDQWGDDFSSQLAPDDRQDRGQLFTRLDVPFETQDVQLRVGLLGEENPQSRNRNPSAHAHWDKRFDDGSSLRVSLDRREFDRTNDADGFEEERDYADQRAEARYKRAWFARPTLGKHLLTAGWRMRREGLESPVRTDGDGDLVPEPVDAAVTQQTLYVQDEVFVGDRWSFAAAVGFDDHDLYGTEASPRISAAWRPVPEMRLSLSWGEGFRAPNLLQLYDRDINIIAPGSANPGYQIVGNPDLRPEVNEAWTAQLDYRGERVRTFASAYRTRYDDLIATELVGFDPTTFSYVNLDGAEVVGLDVGVEWDLGLHVPGLIVALDHSFVETTTRSSLANEDGNRIPFRPRRTWSPRVRYAHPATGTAVSLWGNYIGEQFVDAANVDVIEDHWLLNAKVSKRLHRRLDLFVQGTNVLDTDQSARSTLSASTPVVPRIVSPEAWLVGLAYRIGS